MSALKHRLTRLEKLAPTVDTRAIHQFSTQELTARMELLIEQLPESDGFPDYSPYDERFDQAIDEWQALMDVRVSRDPCTLSIAPQ